MARLALFLLGPPRLERDGEVLQFDTHKILALVAYLVISNLEAPGTRISRESLIALLWPELEPRRARAVLRRNLSVLRSALAGEWLDVDRQTIGTDPQADFWLDVGQFRRLVHAGKRHGHPPEQTCPRCLEALAEAVELYHGDFLEGFGLRDSVAYDDWQFFEAEGLRQDLASVLERLVEGLSAQGNYEAAVGYARRRLVLDPLHEPAHRQLMWLYALTGQRSAALRQYRECARILHEELGLAPADETTALYEQIRSGSFPEASPGETAALVLGSGFPGRAASPRHNLPAQATPLVGRQEEMAEIEARLLDPDCRLLTLLGPGGIGKTRLALQLAQNLVEAEPAAFEHGIFFVPLAPIETAEGVIAAVTEAVGYCCQSDEGNPRATPRQQLLDYLSAKRLLLVMDNYEQLLVEGTPHESRTGAGGESDGVGFLTDLLTAAPGVKVLVTSRASLKVRGEHLVHLAGLKVPEPTIPFPMGDGQTWRDYSAIQLFTQSAQQVRPDLIVDLQNLVHMARICHLVQGMPLGILLAAAWAEMLPPEEIAAEIERSLDFLETDLRDVPPRQRSIRAAVDHSWRLLDEREQELFRGLSVFRGGFAREAARQVTGATLRELMSLANKSLLHTSYAGRYELHELLRQYGTERLDASPAEVDAVRDRHCAYYVDALERWGRELKGARQRDAAAETDLEIENARTAWHWAVEHRQTSRLAQAADGMWLYHARRLRYEEGEAAFRAAARALAGIDSPDVRRLRARCLILRSHFLLDMGRKQQAVDAADQGQSMLQELMREGHDVGPERALAAFHRSRMASYYHPDPLEARRNYQQSAVLYEEVGDRWGLARALASMGWMDEHLGDYGQARGLCEKSLAIRQELGDREGMADSMLNLGVIAWVQGQLDEADHFLRDSVAIFQSLDDWNGVAHAIKSMGEVLVRRGRFVDGLALMESSADIYEDLGHKFGAAGVLPFLGEAKLHLGRYDEGHADARRGKVLADVAKHRWGVGFAEFVQGLAELARGRNQEALASLEGSLTAFKEVRHRENQGWVLGPLGLAAFACDEADLARESVLEALRTGVELEVFVPLMYALPAAMRILAGTGEASYAVEVYACASRYPFVANSRWFDDTAGSSVEAAAASLSEEDVQQARERGQARELADMARVAAAWLESSHA